MQQVLVTTKEKLDHLFKTVNAQQAMIDQLNFNTQVLQMALEELLGDNLRPIMLQMQTLGIARRQMGAQMGGNLAAIQDYEKQLKQLKKRAEEIDAIALYDKAIAKAQEEAKGDQKAILIKPL